MSAEGSPGGGVAGAVVAFVGPPNGRGGDEILVPGFVCSRARACVCACVCARVRARACACVYICVYIVAVFLGDHPFF